ncbi:MAG: alginate export family protein [Bacteroidota bacterium]
MKRIDLILATILFCYAKPGFTQLDASLLEFPEFKLLRSEEDYRRLKGNHTLKRWWQKIKYLPLGKNSFVSLGGDVRTEFQLLNNEEWTTGNHDIALFQRLMVPSDWRSSNQVRIFGQLKNGFTIGRNGPRFSLNDDALAIHQLFVGWQLGHSTFELGRREISYGSSRLLSIREGTNIRQSFDGARWIWKKTAYQLDVLLYAYNPQEVGVFDNVITTNSLLWRAYGVWNLPKANNLNLDIYYLGVRNEETFFEEGSELETRHSFGLRHWGSVGQWGYNNEAIFQFGKFGEGTIRAWTLSTDTYYRFSGKNKATIGLKAEMISGDNDPFDGNLQTFNPLYPRGGYFGLLALIGPANLFDLHPSFKIALTEKWQFNLDWDFFWRHRLNDGIYFPSGRLNLASQNSVERFIGHQPGVQLSFVVNRLIEVEASYFLFIAGPFIKDISDGQRFSQLGASVHMKF